MSGVQMINPTRLRSVTLSLALSLLAAMLCPVGTASAAIAPQVVRSTVAGIDLLAYPTAVKDVVTIVGSFPAGDAMASATPNGNLAAATMAGLLLDKGTARRDKFAISMALDEVGASVGFGVDTENVSIQARCLTKDLPLVLSIMAEELRSPAFSADEFAKAKIDFVGGLQQQDESTGFRAGEAFSRTAFPVGHPNHPASVAEWHAAVDKLTLNEVKAFYKAHYGPSYMTLVVVGDLDVPSLQANVKKAFGGWRGGSARVAGSLAPRLTIASDLPVPVAGKTSVNVLIGTPTQLHYRDPDALALRVGTAIFGSGFTGRLMSTVRDKEGLTYGIGANVSNDTYDDGVWDINATFAPSLLERGLNSTRRELRKWWAEGVTEKELATKKTAMIGSYQVGLATTGGMAGAILQTVEPGLPLSWLDEYPQHINALTLEQVNAAIKNHIDPDHLVTVKAGTLEASATP